MSADDSENKGFRLSRFPLLPANIREQIFKQAFEDSERRAAHLALVCQEATFWSAHHRICPSLATRRLPSSIKLNPLIYANLNLHSRFYPEKFVSFVLQFYDPNNTKFRSFYTNYVQSIYIDEITLHDIGVNFLPLCKNLISLALNPVAPTARNKSIISRVLTPTNFSKLRKLFVAVDPLPGNLRTFLHPIYHYLTHLDIDAHAHNPWVGLETLTSLTHMVYGEFLVVSQCIKEAAHELKALINQSASHFPPHLKCFIINLPIDIIYGAACLRGRSTERQIFDDIVTGRMDRRVVLGLRGGFQNLSNVGLAHIYTNPREHFLQYVPPLPMFDFSTWIYLSLPVGKMDFWDEAEHRIQLREGNVVPQSSSSDTPDVVESFTPVVILNLDFLGEENENLRSFFQ